MIDNFEQVKDILEFNSPTDFYVIEIIKRKKDPGNEYLSKNTKMIDNFYIYSTSALDKYKQIIKERCINDNAIAYIKVCSRDLKDVAVEVISRTSRYIAEEKYRSVQKVYSRVSKYMIGKNKKWTIETEDETLFLDIYNFLRKCLLEFTTLKALNCFQIIIKPFDSREFKKKFPNLELKKDESVILFSNFI